LDFKLNRSIPLFALTEYFLATLRDIYGARFVYHYSSAADTCDVSERDECWSFPIITGCNKGLAEIANALFSVFFYSNFCDPGQIKPDWIESLDTMATRVGIREDPICEQLLAMAAGYASDCKAAREGHSAGDNILTFPHYYALILNPAIAFEIPESGATPFLEASHSAPMGTINIYTRVPVPAALISMFRLSLQSIYLLLRDLEEWQEATVAGRLRESTIIAHQSQDLLAYVRDEKDNRLSARAKQALWHISSTMAVWGGRAEDLSGTKVLADIPAFAYLRNVNDDEYIDALVAIACGHAWKRSGQRIKRDPIQDALNLWGKTVSHAESANAVRYQTSIVIKRAETAHCPRSAAFAAVFHHCAWPALYHGLRAAFAATSDEGPTVEVVFEKGMTTVRNRRLEKGPRPQELHDEHFWRRLEAQVPEYSIEFEWPETGSTGAWVSCTIKHHAHAEQGRTNE
jgi:hypothetical protein